MALFPIRLLLFVTPALAALVALTMPQALALEHAFDCGNIIAYHIRFDPRVASRISVENEISLGLSKASYFLRHEIKGRLNSFGETERKSCFNLAATTYNHLLKYFKRRLEHLLGKRELARFYSEYSLLITMRLRPSERRELQQHFEKLEQRYLHLAYSMLIVSLEQTPWKRFQKIEVRLESWTDEWSALIGREAPAAVELQNNVLALRPLEFSPVELQIFMFHEIAHLADPGLALLTEAYDNELYAWIQTLDYINWLKAQNTIVPERFEAIRRNVEILGTDAWVRAVMRSRLKP